MHPRRCCYYSYWNLVLFSASSNSFLLPVRTATTATLRRRGLISTNSAFLGAQQRVSPYRQQQPFSTTWFRAMSSTPNEEVLKDPTDIPKDKDFNKRKNADEKQQQGNKNKKPKRSTRGKKKDITRPRLVDYDAQPTAEATTPHRGSFAHPSMRTLYNVTIPEKSTTTTTTKRKCALLLGYVGTDYAGFQINPGQYTIHAAVELAMFQAGLLDPRNFGFPHKYSWSTSGRTDKGVHAAAQLCSCKVEVPSDEKDWTTLVRTELNKHLPTTIRVLDVGQVSKGFCAHTGRDRVRYQYLVPSFLFQTPDQVAELCKKHNIPMPGAAWLQSCNNKSTTLTPEHRKLLQTEFASYRATPEQLSTLRTALAEYPGTRAYHNLCRGVASGDDPRAQRYILSFTVEDDPPVVYGDGGIEWIPTTVLGQSFLLNQIRKMICHAVDIVRGVVPTDGIRHALDPNNNHVPVGTAPAEGLFLDQSYYTLYHERTGNPLLTWVSDPEREEYQRWKEFCGTVLRPHIFRQEQEFGNFAEFLYTYSGWDRSKYDDARSTCLEGEEERDNDVDGKEEVQR